MTIDFYLEHGSPPCQVVKMIAKVLGITFNEKHISLYAKDQLKPEFLKINPQHMVPTIVDNGFVLCESRAIIIYLMDQYGKDNSLYPKDPKQRALIHHRLLFDQGTLYFAIVSWWLDMKRNIPSTPDHFKRIDSALELLDTFLENSKYVAGDSLTLADFSIFISVLCAESSGHALKEQFTNVKKWFDHLKTTIPAREVPDVEMKEVTDWIDLIRK